MTRLVPLLLLAASLLVPARPAAAQDKQPSAESTASLAKNENPGEGADFKWHLLNTAIFFAIAGYGIYKFAPAFFNARSADIRKAIEDATGLKLQAEFRSSEIDRKMATLPDEVNRLREEARVAMERERHRRNLDTERDIRGIEASLAAEIDNMRAESSGRIRQQAASDALQLAAQRLREAAPSASDALLGDFVHLVERGNN